MNSSKGVYILDASLSAWLWKLKKYRGIAFQNIDNFFSYFCGIKYYT